jgi:mannan endo-1,4-beta-mannosidase
MRAGSRFFPRIPKLFVALLLAATSVSLILAIATPKSTSATSGVYLGLWQPGAPSDMSKVSEFERDSGKKVAIIQFYYEWQHRLDNKLVDNVVQHGSIPMITWEPQGGCDKINSGAFDSDIRRWASSLAQFKGKTPILLRTMHEMNIPGYAWSVADGGCTDKTYIQAWQRVYRMFKEVGATNVQHVWCPNVGWNAKTQFDSMFPGDDYVDWVCLDGYNWGDDNWQSFGTIFRHPDYDSYAHITALSKKPLLIGEVASTEAGDAGNKKAAWIADALTNQVPSMPRVKAVVWFNENWEDHAFGIKSTTAAKKAFSDSVAGSEYMSRW